MSVANTSAAAAGSLPSSKPKSKIEISSCGLQVFRSQVSFNCSCQATAKLTYLTQHMYHVISISCNSVIRLSMWRAASNAAAKIFSLMSASRKGKAGKRAKSERQELTASVRSRMIFNLISRSESCPGICVFFSHLFLESSPTLLCLWFVLLAAWRKDVAYAVMLSEGFLRPEDLRHNDPDLKFLKAHTIECSFCDTFFLGPKALTTRSQPRKATNWDSKSQGTCLNVSRFGFEPHQRSN